MNETAPGAVTATPAHTHDPADLLHKLVVSIAAGLVVQRELWEDCVRCCNAKATAYNASPASRIDGGRRVQVCVDEGLHGLLVRVED